MIARALIFLALFCVFVSGVLYARATADDGLTLACTVEHMEHPDPAGMQFFALKCADGQATVTVDGDLPLAAWLRAHHEQKVDLDLRTRALKKLER